MDQKNSMVETEKKRIVLRVPQTEMSHRYGGYCRRCGVPLEQSRKSTLCRSCAETELYIKVRDYIRDNDVTEYEVANQFHIPLRLVKKWIIEGRIEYKHATGMVSNCENCGKVIQFGKYCKHCRPQEDYTVSEEYEEDILLRKQVLEDMRTKRDYGTNGKSCL